jgi:replication factor C subunit 2/4
MSLHQIKLPLVEKYRPKNFDDLLFDDFIGNKIKNILLTKQIPNMIMTGEPSTGKTSTILFMAKQIYGKDMYDHVLELNASDDRGLVMIQQTILPFCKKKTSLYKLIILDEADSITTKAQSLLNNIIAEFKETTRFVFICNEGFKIGESIQSRCMILYFPRITKKNLKNKIVDICKKESFNYNDAGIKKLLFSSGYDIRQCINNLECIMYSYSILSEESVDNIIDIPKLYIIKMIIKSCIEKDLKKVMEYTNTLYSSGYSANDIILTFMKYIENKEDDGDEYELPNEIEVYKKLSDSFIKVNLIDNFVQLMACMVTVYDVI